MKWVTLYFLSGNALETLIDSFADVERWYENIDKSCSNEDRKSVV